jgi:hypothetical protein
MNGQHQFIDAQNNQHEVKVLTTNLMKGIIECHFHKNGEVHKKYECRYRFGQIFNLKFILLLFTGSIIIGTLAGLGYVSEEVTFVSLALLLIINFRLFGSTGFLIEEVTT